MPHIELIAAEQSDKPLLRQLLELYRYDASDFDDSDVNAHGFYGYRYLDHYWTEADRDPFLIKADGQIAGFALVNAYSILGSDDVRSIAEFFVMRKYRRQSVGETAARRLLELFPGRWEIIQQEENIEARAFWVKVIERCAKGEIERATVQGKSGLLHVQSFRF